MIEVNLKKINSVSVADFISEESGGNGQVSIPNGSVQKSFFQAAGSTSLGLARKRFRDTLHLLRRLPPGLPEVNFEHGECTFCEACREACKPGALARPDAGGRPWMLAASISDNCLSMQAVTCRVCGEICEPGAISFRLGMDGRADPSLDQARCTGCGACFAPCPVDAITLGAAHAEPDQGSPAEK